jgi:hypothetical protein
MSSAAELAERVAAVLDVCHPVVTEGYTHTSGTALVDIALPEKDSIVALPKEFEPDVSDVAHVLRIRPTKVGRSSYLDRRLALRRHPTLDDDRRSAVVLEQREHDDGRVHPAVYAYRQTRRLHRHQRRERRRQLRARHPAAPPTTTTTGPATSPADDGHHEGGATAQGSTPPARCVPAAVGRRDPGSCGAARSGRCAA